jgi:hypothetical protein
MPLCMTYQCVHLCMTFYEDDLLPFLLELLWYSLIHCYRVQAKNSTKYCTRKTNPIGNFLKISVSALPLLK